MKKLLLLLLLSSSATCIIAQEKPDTASMAYKLAEEQLIGYNNRDIEAFLKPYSDSVTLYMYPNTLIGKGKQQMRLQYADMFAKATDLHCTIVNRMVLKNTVIDKERVVFKKGVPPAEAIAIYTIQQGKIQTVTFIQ